MKHLSPILCVVLPALAPILAGCAHCEAQDVPRPSGGVSPEEVQAVASAVMDETKSVQDWEAWSKALIQLRALVKKNAGKDNSVFAPAIGPLVDIADASSGLGNSYLAGDILTAIGEPAVPKLLEFIKSTDLKSDRAYRVREALRILTRISPRNVKAAEIVGPFLNCQSDAFTGLYALDCLMQLDPQSGEPPLEEALKSHKDGDMAIRTHAALARRPGKAREHVAALIGFLGPGHTCWDIGSRYTAARCLSELGPIAKDAAPALLEMLKAGDAEAARALGKIGADSPEVVAALVETLRLAEGVRDRTDAAGEFGDLDPKATAALRAMDAAGALGDLGPKAAAALPSLEAALRNLQPAEGRWECDARWVVVEALGKIGGEKALPALRETLKNDDRDVRDMARYQIARIEKGEAAAGAPPRRRIESESDLDAVITQLEDPATRMTALRALVQFADGYLKETGSWQLSSMDAQSDELKREAVRAVRCWGKPEIVALALADPDCGFRCWGVDSLGNGLSAQSVDPWLSLLPRLEKIATEDSDANNRSRAVARLHYRKEEAEFLKTLREKEADPSPYVCMELYFKDIQPLPHESFCARTLRWLSSKDEEIRGDWLIFIGNEVNPATPSPYEVQFNAAVFARVLELTHSSSAKERSEAAYALTRLRARDAKAVRERLIEMAGDESEHLRAEIPFHLWELGDTQLARPCLLGLLKDKSDEVRYAAVVALHPEKRVEELKELAGSANKKVADEAIASLWRLEHQPPAGGQ